MQRAGSLNRAATILNFNPFRLFFFFISDHRNSLNVLCFGAFRIFPTSKTVATLLTVTMGFQKQGQGNSVDHPKKCSALDRHSTTNNSVEVPPASAAAIVAVTRVPAGLEAASSVAAAVASRAPRTAGAVAAADVVAGVGNRLLDLFLPLVPLVLGVLVVGLALASRLVGVEDEARGAGAGGLGAALSRARAGAGTRAGGGGGGGVEGGGGVDGEGGGGGDHGGLAVAALVDVAQEALVLDGPVDADLRLDEVLQIEHGPHLGGLTVLGVEVQEIERDLGDALRVRVPVGQVEAAELVDEGLGDEGGQLGDGDGARVRVVLERGVGLVHVEGHLERDDEEVLRIRRIPENALQNLDENLLRVAGAKVEVDGLDHETLQSDDDLGRCLEDLYLILASNNRTRVRSD